MLTEAEKKWLEERETFIREEEAWYSCARCEKFKPNYPCYLRSCLIPWASEEDYRDTAEFEARVSRIMALYLGAPPCGTGKCNNPGFLCPECRLKHARLAVEQEMEK